MSQWPVFAAIAARIGARRGGEPNEGTWQFLEGIGDFGHLVQSARGTVLAPWVEHLGPRPDPHQIEAGLRSGLETTLEEVAHWQPLPWRPALRWCRHLPHLPTVQHLLAGGEARPWMETVPALQPLLADTVRQRRERGLASELAPVVAAWDTGEPLWRGWGRQWRALWPGRAGGDRPLHRLETRVLHHRDLLLSGAGGHAGPGAGERYRRAAGELDGLLRRHPRHPVASYAYLAHTALTYQRLRGLLLQRRLMPQTGVPA